MSESVEFLIRGKIDGVEITPETINLTLFNDFNQQVEDFVAGSVGGGGSRKLLLDSVFVEIKPGSYCLRAAMSVAMLVTVGPQVQLLERQDGISRMDEKRASVVEKWQSKAKSHDDLMFEVRVINSDGTPATIVRIGPDTNFVRPQAEKWRDVETYLFGEVVDIGGENPNVHVKLFATGDTVIVATEKETLRNLERNILYEKAVLRVSGEQNAVTGRFRNLHLMEFSNYNPGYEEDELKSFIEQGRSAWADVPDAGAWLRKLRGGD